MIRTLLSILCVIGGGVIFIMYTKPTYDNVQAIAVQNAQYDAALSKAAELQQIKQTLLSKLNTLDKASLARLQTMLPDQVDNIRLILDLDNIANKHGMALQNVAISSPTSAQGGSAVGAISAGGHTYDSISMSFSTHGTYDQFKAFLADLERSLRVVDIVSLSFSQDQSPYSTNNSALLNYSYSLTLRTYWLR